MMCIFGVFFWVFNMTKSIVAGGVAAGCILGLFAGVMIYRRMLYETRLKKSGIKDIDEMDGRQFEHYLGHLFKAHGYTVQVTRAAGDYGADLVIVKDGKKIVVQAKRYSKSVGLKAVQEVQASIAHYGASEGWVIANREYTDEAYALAKSNRIRLINVIVNISGIGCFPVTIPRKQPPVFPAHLMENEVRGFFGGIYVFVFI